MHNYMTKRIENDFDAYYDLHAIRLELRLLHCKSIAFQGMKQIT